jgi:hypothetical protein
MIGILAPVYDRIERIRTSGGGTVIDRSDIERRSSGRFSHLMVGVRGVRVESSRDVGGGTTPMIISNRAFSGFGLCPMTVYVDGMLALQGGYGDLMNEARLPNVDEMVSPTEIEVVEIYHPTDRLPNEFAGSRAGCGVVLIWTRRGSQ